MLRVSVPPRSRSVAVVVDGPPEVLFALASFRVADREWQDVPPESIPGALRRVYFEDGTSVPPGALQQFARLGTFTFLYPWTSGQTLPAGPLELRVAASEPAADVQVRVMFPEDDGARVLHLRVFSVSERASDRGAGAFTEQAQAILEQAGIHLQIDAVQTLRGTGLATPSTPTSPWEAPGGDLANLVKLGQQQSASDALNVFVVDELPRGWEGISLGTPGPPLPESRYFGVVVQDGEPAALGRTLAHEVSHFLGLRHIRTVTPSGAVIEDGLGDTEPGGENLMENGRSLTLGQIRILQRSPLLRLR